VYSVPNLADFSSPLVLLPLKYLDEVAFAPMAKLSLYEYFNKVGLHLVTCMHLQVLTRSQFGLLKYTYGPPITEEAQRAAKTHLNRALSQLSSSPSQLWINAARRLQSCSETDSVSRPS
jgi:hypothetical protein